ncbi:zona pellucida sperm-binding protein 4-like [Sphaeramia orbicularis]|uniref:zona pellucida sperm-binding protein 4-like n=1 Tax=Sphaeramia orbicularis TaxID=375764 RepID=UPI00117C5B54|nr:zona pellucida sperm-binding protein 4-like [Sphaeramia orbicularis]
MISLSLKLGLIYFILAFTCGCLWCLSAAHERKTPEQRRQLVLPSVTCSGRHLKAVFGPLVRRNIHVTDLTGALIPVPRSEGSCGVKRGPHKNQTVFFISRYASCYTQVQGSEVVIPLHVQLKGEDRWFRVNISCPLIKRLIQRTRLMPTSYPGNCDMQRALRVDCGHPDISSESCYKLKCCYDPGDLTCYYKLNSCSLDGHVVFSVKATDTDPPVDPSRLIVKDRPQCSPVLTTSDTAVFKIGDMDCGARMKVDGNVMIYEMEVEEHPTQSTTKHSSLSLQVECEYNRSDLQHEADIWSFYAVTNPPPAVALGTIRVQMRIATDASFTSFFSEDQLPVTLPLREVAFVEVSIAQPSPDPTLSLRVRDCFAYPASKHSVWTLLYDGCPNLLDNMRSSVPVDNQGKTNFHSQIRRFDVKIFTFLDPHTGHPSEEEMYFYCLVEICTQDVDCAQKCSILSSEGERQRREAVPPSGYIQLISLGPLLLRQNDTNPEDHPCEKFKKMFWITVYILSGVGAALVLILLFIMCKNIRKSQNAEEQQGLESQSDNEQ